jgi:hypothetical protein
MEGRENFDLRWGGTLPPWGYRFSTAANRSAFCAGMATVAAVVRNNGEDDEQGLTQLKAYAAMPSLGEATHIGTYTS